ncbi:MAG: SpoIID/LytB domain-containing protein [Solirubrobacterales bacterium]
MRRATRGALGSAATLLLIAGAAAPASGATWVIKGHGFGHGVGMSAYGAYGLARHGHGYRSILGHYYRHARVRRASRHPVRVLLGSGIGSIGFKKAKKACGKRLHPHHGYRFKRSRNGVALLSSGGRRIARCGRAATAAGKGAVRIRNKGVYRGSLRVKASGGALLVTNVVGLDDYVMGVVANEMPSSWSQPALRAVAVSARSIALVGGRGGSFDVYDDTRSQVYRGKSSETPSTNRACRRTKREILRYHGQVATAFYFSSSGGRTESVQYAFPGASPVRYLTSVNDPYDGISPDHSWRVRYSQGEMESRLSGLFSGRLRRIKVLKRGDSPRIVRAKVVGSRGSAKTTGPVLEARLGLKSTWARFRRHPH